MGRLRGNRTRCRGVGDLSRAGHWHHAGPRTSPPTPVAPIPLPLDPAALDVTRGFGAGPSRAPGSPVRAVQYGQYRFGGLVLFARNGVV